MKRKLSLFIIGIMLSAFIPASALAAPNSGNGCAALCSTGNRRQYIRRTRNFFTTQKRPIILSI